MKKNMLSRVLTLALAALLALSLFACGKKSDDNSTGSSGAASYQVGICSYADDASLNQIVDNIETRLKAIGQEKGVTFEISYDNCNTDSAVLNQIIANFMADKVDLMIGVATPVAVAMQAATEGTDIPVVFAAVSDPVGAGLVESLEAPGANITGTSDYLDTDAILDLISPPTLTPRASPCCMIWGRTPLPLPSRMPRRTWTRGACPTRSITAPPPTRSAWPSAASWPTRPTPCSPPPTTP